MKDILSSIVNKWNIALLLIGFFLFPVLAKIPTAIRNHVACYGAGDFPREIYPNHSHYLVNAQHVCYQQNTPGDDIGLSTLREKILGIKPLPDTQPSSFYPVHGYVVSDEDHLYKPKRIGIDGKFIFVDGVRSNINIEDIRVLLQEDDLFKQKVLQ